MPVNISASPPEPLLMSCYQIFSSGSARRELATALWGTQRTQVSRVGKISGLCSAPASSLLDTTTYGVSFMMPTTAARVLDQILFHRVCSCKCGPLLGGFHFSKVLGWWQWSHFKIPPGNLATCSRATWVIIFSVNLCLQQLRCKENVKPLSKIIKRNCWRCSSIWDKLTCWKKPHLTVFEHIQTPVDIWPLCSPGRDSSSA